MMKKYLTIFLLAVVSFSSCKRDEVEATDMAARDEQLIKDFIAANAITGAVRHQSGLYYVISASGIGNVTYTGNTSVTTKYTGRLLTGQVFDSSATGITFSLGQVIVGWQIGIPLIQKGGKIRLLIPSAYAYGGRAAGTIPPNSVLDFDIELINVN